MFRELETPEDVKGKLFLSGMPGRYTAIENTLKEMREEKITTIVSLASLSEIREKSPSYERVIGTDQLPYQYIEFPIPDYKCPSNKIEFIQWIKSVEKLLRNNEQVLLHCAGGHGRTGVFASCLLQAFGVQPAEEALKQVKAVGSGFDTHEQLAFILNFLKA